VYFVWAGLWLALSPWTLLWDHNWFGNMVPGLSVVMANPFVRGAVSGVGLVTIAAGVRELFGVFAGPASSEPPAAPARTPQQP
jgi:hypothetical protein